MAEQQDTARIQPGHGQDLAKLKRQKREKEKKKLATETFVALCGKLIKCSQL